MSNPPVAAAAAAAAAAGNSFVTHRNVHSYVMNAALSGLSAPVQLCNLALKRAQRERAEPEGLHNPPSAVIGAPARSSSSGGGPGSSSAACAVEVAMQAAAGVFTEAMARGDAAAAAAGPPPEEDESSVEAEQFDSDTDRYVARVKALKDEMDAEDEVRAIQAQLDRAQERLKGALRRTRVVGRPSLWGRHDDQWTKHYREFVGCDNCQPENTNRRMCRWTARQRMVYQNRGAEGKKHGHGGSYAEGRIRLLQELGFDFGSMTKAWDEYYNELVEYKRVHGDCNVKMQHSKELGEWVSRQRKAYQAKLNGNERMLKKYGKYSEERVQRLNEIGFCWRRSASSYKGRTASEVETSEEKRPKIAEAEVAVVADVIDGNEDEAI